METGESRPFYNSKTKAVRGQQKYYLKEDNIPETPCPQGAVRISLIWFFPFLPILTPQRGWGVPWAEITTFQSVLAFLIFSLISRTGPKFF
jgi:hypothetical protein